MKKFYKEEDLVFAEKLKDKRFQDLEGKKFGNTVVIGFAGNYKNNRCWFCRCDCGNITKVYASHLTAGRTVSCGCFGINQMIKHGHSFVKNTTKTYMIWTSMKQRCFNKNDSFYPNYGGRGITVCGRWKNSFENFLEDMGEKPEGLTIERIENDKGYYKENCRWATRKEQGNNRSSNRLLTFNGKTQTMTQWAEDIGINMTSLRARLDRGWPIEKALTTTVKKH